MDEESCAMQSVQLFEMTLKFKICIFWAEHCDDAQRQFRVYSIFSHRSRQLTRMVCVYVDALLPNYETVRLLCSFQHSKIIASEPEDNCAAELFNNVQ